MDNSIQCPNCHRYRYVWLNSNLIYSPILLLGFIGGLMSFGGGQGVQAAGIGLIALGFIGTAYNYFFGKREMQCASCGYKYIYFPRRGSKAICVKCRGTGMIFIVRCGNCQGKGYIDKSG